MAPSNPEPGPSLARAWQLYEWRRYALARDEAQKFLAQSPEDAEAYALLALAHGVEKHREQAQDAATRAIQLAPDSTYPLYVLSLVHYWFDQYESAKRTLDETLRLNPNDPNVYELLAKVHAGEKNFKAAQEAAEVGLSQNAAHVGCHFERASALACQGLEEQSEAAYYDVLRLDPEHALAQAYLGRLAVMRGEFKQALPLLRHALREHPEIPFLQKGWQEALIGRFVIYRLLARLKYYIFDKYFVVIGCLLFFVWYWAAVYLFKVNRWPGGYLAWIVLGFLAANATLAFIYLLLKLILGMTSRTVLLFDRDRRKVAPT
jgi:tetratricopeptide (TPR) repeat protein